MKQILLGHFSLGHENVTLYGMPGETGGEFYCCPDSTSPARIKVGLAYTNWDECLAVLLHEVFELALERKSCRFRAAGSLNHDSAAVMFFLDHTQFGDACSRAAMFLSAAMPAVATAWKKHRR